MARSSRRSAATPCSPIARPPTLPLSPPFQRLCDGLTALHSARLPYGRDGIYARETAQRTMQIVTGEAAEAVQAHPACPRPPGHGRRALYCSPVYTIGIEGMTRDEGYAILGHLFPVDRPATVPVSPPLGARHPADLGQSLHAAFAEGGYDGHLRVMHRTTVAGEAVAGI